MQMENWANKMISPKIWIFLRQEKVVQLSVSQVKILLVCEKFISNPITRTAPSSNGFPGKVSLKRFLDHNGDQQEWRLSEQGLCSSRVHEMTNEAFYLNVTNLDFFKKDNIHFYLIILEDHLE